MKTLFLVLLIFGSFSRLSFADCKSELELKIEESKEFKVKPVSIMSASSGPILFILIPPVGIGIAGAGAIFLGNEIKNNSQRHKLIQVIDEAYAYRENKSHIGDKLFKVFKKMKRIGPKSDFTLEDVALSIIDSNESNVMCERQSLRSYSKYLYVNMHM